MTKHLWKGNLETADICGYIYIMYIDFIGTYIYDYIYSSFCYKIFKCVCVCVCVFFSIESSCMLVSCCCCSNSPHTLKYTFITLNSCRSELLHGSHQAKVKVSEYSRQEPIFVFSSFFQPSNIASYHSLIVIAPSAVLQLKYPCD